ncbi:MAG: peptidyl-prolyl cis-trans isomerase, partial [Neisseriaceae bacterium]|nr:peptidyl-prolyl cis-trans isomerase [Neisseriaceae bacterium]
KSPVTEQEVRQEYTRYSNFYKGTNEIQLAEIVTKSEDDAKKVLAELKKGKKFADVAKKYTIDEVGKQNGGMHKGYVNPKDLPPQLGNVVGNLKKGQYTQPINGGNMWAIFAVQDLRPAKVPTFDQVKEGLKAQLEADRVDQAVAELLKKATIK